MGRKRSFQKNCGVAGVGGIVQELREANSALGPSRLLLRVAFHGSPQQSGAWCAAPECLKSRVGNQAGRRPKQRGELTPGMARNNSPPNYLLMVQTIYIMSSLISYGLPPLLYWWFGRFRCRRQGTVALSIKHELVCAMA